MCTICVHAHQAHNHTAKQSRGKNGTTTTQPQEKKDRKKIRGLILPLRITAKKKKPGKK